MRSRGFFVLVLAGTGVAVLGAVLFFSDFLPGHSAFQPPLVVFTDGGFAPLRLTVRQGETVVFENNSSSDFWPASNLHPIHTQYPGSSIWNCGEEGAVLFDACRPIPPGESWSFIFGKLGAWEYHDHLGPAWGGVVVVRSATGGAAVQENVAEEVCRQNPNTPACWTAQLFDTMETQGIPATFEQVSSLYRENEQFAESCHSITHELGLRAVRFYLDDPESALTPSAIICAAGFYHGFNEGLLSTSGADVSLAIKACAFFGERLNKEAPDTELQCYHGIGHGAFETAIIMNAPSNLSSWIGKGLELCERASSGESEKLYRCASGLYNSLANFYIAGLYELEYDGEDPLKDCHEQPDVYKESCYGNMNSLLAWITEGDLGRALVFINKIPEEEFRVSAVEYLGRIMAFEVKKRPREMVSACRGARPALHDACVKGLVLGLMEHGTPGEEYLDALGFCETAGMNEPERTLCLDITLLNLRGWYSAEKSVTICEGLSEEYRSLCRVPGE